MVLSLNEEGLAAEGIKSAVNVYDGPVHRLGCNEFGKLTCLRKITDSHIEYLYTL